MAYTLEGTMLEVCTCNVLCPCWVGEDPDGGTCEPVVAWNIRQGTIDGVDVAGRTFALIVHLPGNVMTPHSWRVVVYVDERCSDEQETALLNAWTGKLGGPLADQAQLIGEVIAVERQPIDFKIEQGKGTLHIGSIVETEIHPKVGPHGETTTLNESIFSNIPGSPAWVSKATSYKRNSQKYGLKDVDIKDHNAMEGVFRFNG